MGEKRGREVQRLDPEAVRAFLESKPAWAVLSTVGPDGFPHSVPLGYFMLGDDLVLGTLVGTQKLRNIERNPRVSVLVEKSQGSVLTGVMLQGEAELIHDDAERLELQLAAARQRGAPDDELPKAPRPGGVYVRVRPKKTITWHYA